MEEIININKQIKKLLNIQCINFIFIAIFKGIGFVIIIFCSLVFNEILILHFCEFDKYIEANIAQRGELELRATNDTGSSSLTKDDDEYVSTTRTFESELSII